MNWGMTASCYNSVRFITAVLFRNVLRAFASLLAIPCRACICHCTWNHSAANAACGQGDEKP